MNDISQEISYDVVREQCTEVQTETLYTTVINSVNIACYSFNRFGSTVRINIKQTHADTQRQTRINAIYWRLLFA